MLSSLGTHFARSGFTASGCAGPYRMANCLIEERMVYTNKIPCGHMRAPGDPQGFFANESQMERSSSQYSRPRDSASSSSVVTSCVMARPASGPT